MNQMRNWSMGEYFDQYIAKIVKYKPEGRKKHIKALFTAIKGEIRSAEITDLE